MARKKKPVKLGPGKPELSFVDGLPNEDTFDVLYERYTRGYKSAKGKLRAGETMYLQMRNREQFKQLYIANLNEEKAKGIGEGTSEMERANRLVQKMVEDDRYWHSNAQARNYRKGMMLLYGETPELVDVRSGKMEEKIEQLETDLATLNRKMKAGGLEAIKNDISPEAYDRLRKIYNDSEVMKSGYDRRNILAQAVFGS